ncbi:MAG TPA: polyprenyl synthetase family protein [Methanomassiliicoccaceae archaeon]|jgi:geranylgeranyl diphosphate synthase type I|nr:polyprenyl synthetase family protein [Euryarchaeota archaeon]HOB39196.1 polyprenyl synthetase family protein [Methanomassiliicoccaceae archaeon]HOL07339.1 polyprenyl synthetase family protein [Methanomassiliicoccaceae archaeon]HOQ25690.1 polyprenyl synthetase family protein [Methanomassiliicoccaceae archaeon]HPP44975.1 polyprenyl synthetase family protein [Methanomassiliicoccaceae archaeon]
MDVIADLEERAKRVNEAIASYLESGENQKLLLAVQHYPSAGGKRLRPVLAEVVAQAVGGAGEKAVPFGAAIEIIHNFTLVHDDVMDNDSMRRGRPSVHVLFDVPTAIIAGDALFARAFETLSDVDVPPQSTRRLLKLTAHAVWLIAEGQQEDMDFERIPPTELAIGDYERMIWKKTAVLFECAAEGGAIIAGGTEEQIDAMRDYARSLGIGFQIYDDVLALLGDKNTTGKPVGNDIRNGKRTLIVLHALQNLAADDPRRTALLTALGNANATPEQIDAAIQALQDCGSIDYALEVARQHAAQGKKHLEVLKPSPERDFLAAIIDYAVNRKS